jgi:hypothetical protein
VGRRARAAEAAEVVLRAASAAGVGLLLSAGPASARIVYTPAYINLFGRSPSAFPLDLNHDGITDFEFYPSGSDIFFLALRVSPAQTGNAILGKIQGALSGYGAPFTCHVGSALPPGHRVGPGSKFGAYGTMFMEDFGQTADSGPWFHFRCGYWGKAQGRFLGFEFMVRGQTHFGWARLNAVLGLSEEGIGATLTGYAYETEPGKPIRAGDTGPIADARAPATAATLRPATLGLLALGSRGLDIWRKEQEK